MNDSELLAAIITGDRESWRSRRIAAVYAGPGGWLALWVCRHQVDNGPGERITWQPARAWPLDRHGEGGPAVCPDCKDGYLMRIGAGSSVDAAPLSMLTGALRVLRQGRPPSS